MNLMLTNNHVLTILHSLVGNGSFLIPSPGRGALELCVGREGFIQLCYDRDISLKPLPTPSQGRKSHYPTLFSLSTMTASKSLTLRPAFL